MVAQTQKLIVMYYVIYENSAHRGVSFSKETIEECNAYIERSKTLDTINHYNYIIVKMV